MNRKFIAAVLGIRSLQRYIYEALQMAFIFEEVSAKQRKFVIRIQDYIIVRSATTIDITLGKVEAGFYNKIGRAHV